jgi:hypothetical protein
MNGMDSSTAAGRGPHQAAVPARHRVTQNRARSIQGASYRFVAPYSRTRRRPWPSTSSSWVSCRSDRDATPVLYVGAVELSHVESLADTVIASWLSPATRRP